MARYIVLYLLMTGVCFTACEKKIDMTLPSYQDKLVVEGSIENGEVPMVLLTKSIPYFSTIDFQTLANEILINDAKVKVVAGDGEEEVLQMSPHADSPLFVAYTGKTLKGKCNMTYRLEIEWNSKKYTATTFIPNTFTLDSLWLNPVGNPADSNATVRVLMNDNANEQNYYRFFVKVKGKLLHDRLWVYTLPLVFDDIPFNGLTFNYEIMRGIPSTLYASALSDEEKKEYYRASFKPGDTIDIKYSQIDYTTFRFWSTAMSELTFGQNIFMSPAPIEGNVQSEQGEQVLGAWCGYAATRKTIIYQ
ncbi:MAG: DUF4249 domain-containing protein [Bacteroidales bacterium]|jgi:hypothetical protein|nr:DUF4249 domain-containing protein [Bacteroidales bacterium]